MIKPGSLVHAIQKESRQDFWILESEDMPEISIQVPPFGPFTKGKRVEVLILERNESGQWMGSLQLPGISAGEVAFLELKNTTHFGCFFGWGPEKDLFCPLSLSLPHLRPGLFYPVMLSEDKVRHRLIANMKWKNLLQPAGPEYEKGKEVEILVVEPVPLGFSVLADQKYAGMLYENQIFSPVRPGQKIKAFVNKRREEDGKLDILLQKPGFAEVGPASQRILDALKSEKGRIHLGDKSPAEDIYSRFRMSKKIFKKALGQLFKAGKIGMNEQSFWLESEDGD